MPITFLPTFLRIPLSRTGKMISYFFGIPLSMLQAQEAKWTISWILLISLSYTYAVSRITGRSLFEEDDTKPQQIRRHTLAHARRLQAAKLAQRQLEEMQERLKRGPLPIFNLPPELVLTILGHCSDWPQTYLSLVRVSKDCSRMTQNACLSRMPVLLIDEAQINSFHLMLHRNPSTAKLIHHVWVTPAKEELLNKCTEIVYDCRNLRSLATTVMIFDVSIVRPRRHDAAKVRHEHLKDVTFLLSLSPAWSQLLNDSKAMLPLQRITHLRVIMDRIPMPISLPNLTHFSYRLLQQGSDGEALGQTLFEEKSIYPMLQTVIMTQPSPAGLRIRRVGQKKFFVFEIQNGQSELEIWCDNARQRGIWMIAADSRPSR